MRNNKTEFMMTGRGMSRETKMFEKVLADEYYSKLSEERSRQWTRQVKRHTPRTEGTYNLDDFSEMDCS